MAVTVKGGMTASAKKIMEYLQSRYGKGPVSKPEIIAATGVTIREINGSFLSWAKADKAWIETNTELVDSGSKDKNGEVKYNKNITVELTDAGMAIDVASLPTNETKKKKSKKDVVEVDGDE